MSRFQRNRDYYAGALMALIGAGAILEGSTYGVGKLTAMGSGFFPVALGVGLVLMGGLMAVFRAPAPADAPGAHAAADVHRAHAAADVRGAHAAGSPDWRGAFAIAASVVLFIALAKEAGLFPAIFACVTVAALGTRSTTLKQAALLGLAVAVFGVLVFSLGLKVQFPILRGVL
jgi:hypothetical protein